MKEQSRNVKKQSTVSGQNDPCKDIANYAGQGNSSVVVAVASFSFVLIKCDNFGISHVLRNFA